MFAFWGVSNFFHWSRERFNFRQLTWWYTTYSMNAFGYNWVFYSNEYIVNTVYINDLTHTEYFGQDKVIITFVFDEFLMWA